MRIALSVLAVIGAVALGTLAATAPDTAKAAAPAPEAAYAACRDVQDRIEAVDEEIRSLEHDIRRVEKALENYRYVQATNDRILARLNATDEPE